MTPKIVIITDESGGVTQVASNHDTEVLMVTSDPDAVKTAIEENHDVYLLPNAWDPMNPTMGDQDEPEMIERVDVQVDPEFVEAAHDYFNDADTRTEMDQVIRKRWWDNLKEDEVTEDDDT